MSRQPPTERNCGRCGRPFVAPHAKWCDDCRWTQRGKPAKYVWTPARDAYLRAHYDSRIKGRAAAVAAHFGWPKWTITHRAARLGLAHTKSSNWTAAEDRLLVEHAGRRTPHWIAKALGRTTTAIVVRLKRLKISQRYVSGYTLGDLTVCFGTDHHVIRRWVREGKLHVTTRGTARARDAWAVTDAHVLRFIQAHPNAFELRKVDQPWFMELLLGAGVVAKALDAAEQRKESA